MGSATHRKGLREAASRGEVPNGVPPDFRRGHDEWYAYVRGYAVCESGTSTAGGAGGGDVVPERHVPPRELGAGGFDAKHHWGVRRRRGVVVVIVDDDR